MIKTSLTISSELLNIAKQYAQLKHTSVSQLIRNYFLELKEELAKKS